MTLYTDEELDADVMLTTVDNPYSPFTQFDDWYSYDVLKGHNTCSLLARMTKGIGCF